MEEEKSCFVDFFSDCVINQKKKTLKRLPNQQNNQITEIQLKIRLKINKRTLKKNNRKLIKVKRRVFNPRKYIKINYK